MSKQRKVKLVEQWGAWFAVDVDGTMLSPLPVYLQNEEDARHQLFCDVDYVRSARLLMVDHGDFLSYLRSPAFIKISEGVARQHLKLADLSLINEVARAACADFIKGLPDQLLHKVEWIEAWWKYYYLDALRDPDTIIIEEDPIIIVQGLADSNQACKEWVAQP